LSSITGQDELLEKANKLMEEALRLPTLIHGETIAYLRENIDKIPEKTGTLRETLTNGQGDIIGQNVVKIRGAYYGIFYQLPVDRSVIAERSEAVLLERSGFSGGF
jgi:hypothetical protein